MSNCFKIHFNIIYLCNNLNCKIKGDIFYTFLSLILWFLIPVNLKIKPPTLVEFELIHVKKLFILNSTTVEYFIFYI